MKRIAVLFSLLMFAGLSLGQESPATLDEVVRAALERNPKLKAAQSLAEAQKSEIKPAGALPDPVVGFSFKNMGLTNITIGEEVMIVASMRTAVLREIPLLALLTPITKGFGDTKPAAPNTAATGCAHNRRMEYREAINASTFRRSTRRPRQPMPLARIRVVTGSALLLAALPVIAIAQEAAKPSQASGWKWKYGPPGVTETVSAGERTEVLAMGKAIESIFWRVPELAGQKGFELATQFSGGAPSASDPQPIESIWRLWFHEPSRKATHETGQTCIEVYVNRQLAGNRAIGGDRDESGRLLFVEADVDTKMAGATEVREGLRWLSDSAVRRSGYVTFSRGSAAPWISVSREEWLRALIFDAEGKDGNPEKSVRAALEKTAYQQWLEGTAERKKNVDAAVTAVAQSQGRAAAEEMRKTLEQTNREVGEQLKAQEAEERERNKQVLSTSTRGDALRAQIAALSPAERASGAFVDHSGQLVAANDPLGHRVLTPDPAFWRVRRSRAEVHTISVHFDWDSMCAKPSTLAALEMAWQNVDWAALKRLVERP